MAVQKILPQQINTTGSSNTQVLTSNGTSTYWGTGVSGYVGSQGYAGIGALTPTTFTATPNTTTPTVTTSGITAQSVAHTVAKVIVT